MKIVSTKIPEVLVIEPIVHQDARGFFMELFSAEKYLPHGIPGFFVQDNLSRSSHGVVRGLHLQHPGAQGKLISVLRGRILDVAVDVRRGSPTFGQHVAVELDDQDKKLVWVPRGFAHGFAVLSETADFFYKCDAPYNPASEIAIRWNDPTIGIDWKIENPILSARDASAPLLTEVDGLPLFGSV